MTFGFKVMFLADWILVATTANICFQAAGVIAWTMQTAGARGAIWRGLACGKGPTHESLVPVEMLMPQMAFDKCHAFHWEFSAPTIYEI